MLALIIFACVNQTLPVIETVIQEIGEAELLVDRGEYAKARKELAAYRNVPSAALRARILDLRGLVSLRLDAKPESWVLQHFIDRQRANKRDPRFKAWLAEAQLAAGNSVDALTLITQLADADLMPDHHAYVVLAKLSIGEARTTALA